jgi:DNA invertase Pin-like site-specific DNA recombinase
MVWAGLLWLAPEAVMSKLIRCAVYTRKSTEEGLEQDFNSLQVQREACEAYIKSQKHEGWQLIKTHYDDGGFSGGSMDRPALQQLMRDIEAGKVDVIVVYKVDRLSRSLHDFARMVEVFDRHKVSFVSVTQQFNTTTSMGRLTLNVLLSFAQFEREVTGERIRDKIAASKKKGMWMGGVVPLGYDVKDRKLVINPAEAETVRFIYKRYLELGCVRELWNDLRQKKIVTKTIPTRPGSGGKPFSRGGLYHFLNNPIFIGQIRFREAIYDGQHEPIINLKTWDAVQKMLAGNRAGLMGKCHKDEQAILRGKLYDAVTGEQLAANSSTKNGRRYRYYITRSLYKETRASAPTGWRLSGPVIEKTVDMVVRSMLADRSSILSAFSNADIPATLIPHVLEQARAVLTRAEQIIEGYVSKVSIGPDRIEVKLSLAKLIPEGMELPDIIISQTKPMRMQRRNNEMRLVLDGDGSDTAIDSLLVKGIAQAHVWAEELFTGQADSLVELAEKHKVSEGYLKRLMPLAFLAPDIVTSILAGKQPDSLNKQKLASETLPLIWQEQRNVLGFDAAQ